MFLRLACLWTLLFASFVTQSGCGSGSDSDDSSSSVAAPTISTQPSSQSVTVGDSVTFTVVATGDGTLSYQWRKDGTSVSGATSASLTLSSVAASDAADYDVVVSNDGGSVTSSAATLTVSSSTGAPLINTQPSSQSVVEGNSVTFSVSATGSGTLSYQWQKDGSDISGATSSSYSLSAVSSSDAGDYSVVVSNSVGSVSSNSASLTVTVASTGTLSTEVTTAAQTFLATLSSSQQATVQLSWDLDTARHWSNLPASMVSRNGLKWGNLSSTQQSAARAMIQTALSSTGDSLHQGLQAADAALVSLYSASSSTYGSGHYYIAFLGTPSATGFWLLQLTGHHLTYNIAFNGSYASPTPLFLGVEPKGSFTLSGTTYDPMEAQRTAFSNLGAALTSYSSAKLSGTYSDLKFGANGSGNIDGTCPRSYSSYSGAGILYTSLSSTDQALVQAAIKSYVNTQATEYADDLLSAYLSSTALASTYVAYSGSGTVTTSGNYFRIDGPRVWIEFSVQGGVIVSGDIHYHTIWRDKVGDYGGKCVE